MINSVVDKAECIVRWCHEGTVKCEHGDTVQSSIILKEVCAVEGPGLFGDNATILPMSHDWPHFVRIETMLPQASLGKIDAVDESGIADLCHQCSEFTL